MKVSITVKKQTGTVSTQWGVFVDGVLHEGGFSTRAAAEACAEATRREFDDMGIG